MRIIADRKEALATAAVSLAVMVFVWVGLTMLSEPPQPGTGAHSTVGEEVQR